jgi:hypothetical protein
VSHRESKTNRDRCINRITTTAQDGNTNIGGVWFDRDHHGMPGMDGLAGKEGIGPKQGQKNQEESRELVLHAHKISNEARNRNPKSINHKAHKELKETKVQLYVLFVFFMVKEIA